MFTQYFFIISTGNFHSFLKIICLLNGLHYIPVYRQPYYAKLGASAAGCPEAERYYAEAITLPLYPALTEKQQDRVIEALREACS